MESIQNKDLQVTFPHGKRYRYTFSIFMLANGLFIGLKGFFNLSLFYYILFVSPFVPFLYISLRSQNIKHKLQFGDNLISIGEVILPSETIRRIVIYKPITIYIYKDSNFKKTKKVITIQTDKVNSEYVMGHIQVWAQNNNIKLEINY